MSFLSKLFGKKDTPKPVVERNMFNLQMEDIVTYDLEDYTVVSKLSYDDHGFKWHAYQLEGMSRTIWLSVEMDDELNLGIYEKVKMKLTLPIPKKIEHDGTYYYLDESGSAKVYGVGRGQNVNGITCEYFDFCDEEEERFLSVEKWGSEIEVSSGYEIEEYELKIIASN
ncbi:DUF4178 domain-containing protein [Metabacillus arenae]|uniref:DUF4178 domain-containing protein n=1 Tax=Metabacillus arenae TaxID=2771434 RepID=A0A926S0S0_9BACI|nr:DUF4178 domain-containing protein [Metabacillus arenae]MBD1380299.1 DUF4178 domain-containing protein [Metabacillus arenae]